MVAAPALAEPVSYSRPTVQGVTVHLVTVDLNAEGVVVRPEVASTGETVDFGSLLRNRPTAAITGTFFDTRSGIIVGNLAYDGRLMTEGYVGSTILIDRQGQARMESVDGNLGRHMNWTEAAFAISGGPTLLVDGEVAIDPRSEGFSDPSLFGRRPRAALGVTDNNKLLMVTSNGSISLHQLARVMRDLGSRNAINLDGGSSTALYYKGSVLSRPARRLTNVIAVYSQGDAPSDAARLSSQYGVAFQHYNKGMRLLGQGQWRLAQSQLRKAIALAPDLARYWEALSQAEEARGETLAAAEALARAAQLHIEWSRLDEARACAEAALRLVPDHAISLELLSGLGGPLPAAGPSAVQP